MLAHPALNRFRQSGPFRLFSLSLAGLFVVLTGTALTQGVGRPYKVTIKDARQAVQMFGPAQYAVAKAVADSVAEGVIPANEADDLYVTVGVFIHWEAKDDKKIQDFNYRATKEAIARAVKGEPKASEVTAKKDSAHHPFAAG